MTTQPRKTHSLIGVAACIMAVVMIVAFAVASLIYYLQFNHTIEGGIGDGLGLLQMMSEMVLPIPVHIIGLILGIAAAFFPNRKKLFPILAIVLNLIFGLCSLFPWLYLAVGSLGRVQ